MSRLEGRTRGESRHVERTQEVSRRLEDTGLENTGLSRRTGSRRCDEGGLRPEGRKKTTRGQGRKNGTRKGEDGDRLQNNVHLTNTFLGYVTGELVTVSKEGWGWGELP